MITLEQELTAAVAGLSRDLRLTVIDLVRIAAAIYQVKLDPLGVPQVQLRTAIRALGSLDIADDTSLVVCAAPGTGLPEYLQPLMRDRPQSLVRVTPETDVLATL